MNFKREFSEFLELAFFLEPGMKIDPERSLVEQGVVDSMGLIEIAAHLDKRYGMIIDLDELTGGSPVSINKIEHIIRAHFLKETL
jgi:acyl carrier protein